MKARDIKLKLYLEGVPMPFTSISINEQVGATSTALVTMPATPLLAKLHNKTLIHVFYKNVIPGENEAPKFYLIFEGEMSSYTFNKSESGNNISLQFAGLTSNWKRTFKTIMDFSLNTFSMGKYLLISSNPYIKQPIADIPKAKEKKEKEDKSKVKQANMMFTRFPGSTISNRIAQSLKKYFAGGKTPIKNTIKSLLQDLENSNPHYHKIQELYKIRQRIEALENDEIIKTMESKAVQEMITKSVDNLPPLSDGSQILKSVLDKLDYFYVEPAAPTLGADGFPKSAIFSPESMFMVPLRCNTFFPNDFSQSTYTHNYDVEPTRYVVQTPPLSLSNVEGYQSYTLNSKFVVPQEKMYLIEQDGDDDPKDTHKGLPAMDFSQEELLFGPNPQVGNYDSAELGYASFTRFATGQKTTDKVSEQAIQAKFRGSGIGTYIRGVVKFKYLKAKYSTRSYSIMATYNPARLIGFPGLVINTDTPHVIGKITGINTVLNATGQGTSSVTFQYNRTIQDYDFKSEKGNEPWSTGNGVFDEFLDDWPEAPFWIDNARYGFNNVGNTLKTLVDPDAENKVTIDFHSAKAKISPTGNRTKDIFNRVSKAINELKKKYAIYGDDPHVFTDRETYRRLVDEETFWSFFLDKKELNYNDESLYQKIIGRDKKEQEEYNYYPSSRYYAFDDKKKFMADRRNRVLLAKKDFHSYDE